MVKYFVDSGKAAEGMMRIEHIELHHHAINVLAEIVSFAKTHTLTELARQARQQLHQRLAAFQREQNTREASCGVFRSLLLVDEHEVAFQFAQDNLDMLWFGRALRWLARANRPRAAYEILLQLPPEKREKLEATDRAFIYAQNDLLELALAEAEQVPKVRPQDGAYCELAVNFARVGKPLQALQIVDRIHQTSVRTWVLAGIGTELLSRGDRDGAQQMLNRLLQEAAKAPALSFASLLTDMAQTLAAAGQGSEAATLGTNETVNCDDLFISAAESHLDAGNLLQAESQIVQIQDLELRSNLLARLIDHLSKANMLDHAQKLLADISPQMLNQTLIYLVRGLARVGQVVACEELIVRIPSLRAQDDAYREMILVELGEQQFESAISLLEQIQSERRKGPVQVAVAAALAKHGKIQQALTLVQRISNSEQRAEAHASLASKLWRTEDAELLHFCLDACEGTRFYRKAITACAIQMIRAERLEEAVRLVDKHLPPQRQGVWMGLIRSLIELDGPNAINADIWHAAERYQVNVAFTIVSTLLSSGRIEEAAPFILQQDSPYPYVSAHSRLAIQSARTGRLNEGLDLLVDHPDQGSTDATLTKMSEGLIERGDLENALMLSDRIQSTFFRKQTWSNVARYFVNRSEIYVDVQLRSIYVAFQIARRKGQEDVKNCLLAFSPLIVMLLSSRRMQSLLSHLEQVQGSLFVNDA